MGAGAGADANESTSSSSSSASSSSPSPSPSPSSSSSSSEEVGGDSRVTLRCSIAPAGTSSVESAGAPKRTQRRTFSQHELEFLDGRIVWIEHQNLASELQGLLVTAAAHQAEKLHATSSKSRHGTRALFSGWYTSTSMSSGTRWTPAGPSPSSKLDIFFRSNTALDDEYVYIVSLVQKSEFPAESDHSSASVAITRGLNSRVLDCMRHGSLSTPQPDLATCHWQCT